MDVPMTLGALNATFSEEFINLASEAAASTSIPELVFSLIAYFLMAALALQIYREVSKIYSFMEYEGLKYFKNAFLFYGFANFFLVSMTLALLLAKSSVPAVLYLMAVVLLPFFFFTRLSFWFAKANLLSSIIWKLVEGIVRTKTRKALFFLSVMLLVLMDVVVYLLISVFAGDYIALGYKAVVFVFILLLIRSNMRSGGENKAHYPPLLPGPDPDLYPGFPGKFFDHN
ncbi:TPA: hypothetical protein HA351_07715 [Methanosarcinaceae archaeon]|nr:hypothetical protein [Methanosarcinaceae archaeon]